MEKQYYVPESFVAKYQEWLIKSIKGCSPRPSATTEKWEEELIERFSSRKEVVVRLNQLWESLSEEGKNNVLKAFNAEVFKQAEKQLIAQHPEWVPVSIWKRIGLFWKDFRGVT